MPVPVPYMIVNGDLSAFLAISLTALVVRDQLPPAHQIAGGDIDKA